MDDLFNYFKTDTSDKEVQVAVSEAYEKAKILKAMFGTKTSTLSNKVLKIALESSLAELQDAFRRSEAIKEELNI